MDYSLLIFSPVDGRLDCSWFAATMNEYVVESYTYTWVYIDFISIGGGVGGSQGQRYIELYK